MMRASTGKAVTDMATAKKAAKTETKRRAAPTSDKEDPQRGQLKTRGTTFPPPRRRRPSARSVTQPRRVEPDRR
jgi:hypothetical protein